MHDGRAQYVCKGILKTDFRDAFIQNRELIIFLYAIKIF